MDLVGQQKTSWVGVIAVWALLAAMVVTGALLWASTNPVARVAAVLTGFVTVGIGAVLNRGGIIQDDMERDKNKND
jgi:NAD/NADP transhydrogenase alpha subunit